MKTFFVKIWRLVFPIKNEIQTENTDIIIEPIEVTESLELTNIPVETKKQTVKKTQTKKSAVQKATVAKKTTNKKK